MPNFESARFRRGIRQSRLPLQHVSLAPISETDPHAPFSIVQIELPHDEIMGFRAIHNREPPFYSFEGLHLGARPRCLPISRALVVIKQLEVALRAGIVDRCRRIRSLASPTAAAEEHAEQPDRHQSQHAN